MAAEGARAARYSFPAKRTCARKTIRASARNGISARSGFRSARSARMPRRIAAIARSVQDLASARPTPASVSDRSHATGWSARVVISDVGFSSSDSGEPGTGCDSSVPSEAGSAFTDPPEVSLYTESRAASNRGADRSSAIGAERAVPAEERQHEHEPEAETGDPVSPEPEQRRLAAQDDVPHDDRLPEERAGFRFASERVEEQGDPRVGAARHADLLLHAPQ